MHGGGFDGLVTSAIVVLIGAACLFSFLIFILVSRRHSFHGVKGVALYLVITALLISLAAVLDNVLWDALSIRNRCVAIGICTATAYLIPLTFLGRLYRKETKSRINLALLVCSALLLGLLGAWYIAERAS